MIKTLGLMCFVVGCIAAATIPDEDKHGHSISKMLDEMHDILMGEKEAEMENIIQYFNLNRTKGGAKYQYTYHSNGSSKEGKGRSSVTSEISMMTPHSRDGWWKLKDIDVGLMWHAGGQMIIHTICDKSGHHEMVTLGNPARAYGASFQHFIPADTWFAVENPSIVNYVLTSSIMAPGWDDSVQYKEVSSKELAERFPQHAQMIKDFQSGKGHGYSAHDDYTHGDGHEHTGDHHAKHEHNHHRDAQHEPAEEQDEEYDEDA